MGYYVTLRDSSAFIPSANIAECNKIWQDANSKDDNKSGGQLGEGKYLKKWFSWMPEDWTELTTENILEEMGFEIEIEENGIQKASFSWEVQSY